MGVIIRLSVKDISTMGRYTQGVRLIRIQDEEEVATVARVEISEEPVEDLLQEGNEDATIEAEDSIEDTSVESTEESDEETDE
jgi:DNA gyrase subunit A